MMAEHCYRRDKIWLNAAFTIPGPLADGAEAEAAMLMHLLESHAADCVHLRKPEAGRDYMRLLLAALTAEARSCVVMHDFFDLAAEYDAGGIQLNSRNHEVPEGWKGRITKSCHTLDEVLKTSPQSHYVTLSPVFDSLSKNGYRAAFTPESLQGQLPTGKVLALGGVTPHDLFRLRRAGFAGSAMLGWFWQGGVLDNRMRAAALRLKLLRAFPLLLITDSPDVEQTVRQARAAYAGGCTWVQVRMKEATTAERIEAARGIMAQCPKMLVSIDDDCEAVALSGAHGVHLGKNDIGTAEARAIVGDEVILGRTANSFADVATIVAECGGDGVDYIGMGPLRFTTTKRRLAPEIGFGGYAAAIVAMRAAGIHLPVLAIGGVTAADVPRLATAGIEGVAVSGAVNKASDSAQAAKKLLDTVKTNIWKTTY